MASPAITVSDWGDAVFLALTNALNMFLAAIPLVIGAILILIVGWIIAAILARITRAALRAAKVDELFARHGQAVYGDATNRWQPSTVAAEVVKWVIRLVFLVAAANTLGLTQVSTLLDSIILWIPNLIVAAIVLLVAPLLARFVRGLIEAGATDMGFTNGPLLGRLAQWAVIAFAVIIAINQVGIAANLVNTLFIAFVGAIALAFGLAFGLGGREVAAQITQQWYESSQSAASKVAEKASQPMDGGKAGAAAGQRTTVYRPASASSTARSK